MQSRALLLGLAVLLATTSLAHAEDFGPLYMTLGYGALGSIILGVASTAWVAIKSQRRWVWFLAPAFIFCWLVIFLVGFRVYADR